MCLGYVVSTSESGQQMVNDDDTKEYVLDRYAGVHVPLYYLRGVKIGECLSWDGEVLRAE